MFDEPEQAADVESVPTERLEAWVSELAAHLASATCRFLTMVGELDRRRAWASWGMTSCAAWLSWHCGLGMNAAREQVRVARALLRLPLLHAEFAAGRLSYSKVRAITRIATPELERDLVELAHASTAAQVERWVRGYRRADHLEGTEDSKPYEVTWYRDDDGALVVGARLAPEDGTLLLAALDAARTALAASRRPRLVDCGTDPATDPSTAPDARGSAGLDPAVGDGSSRRPRLVSVTAETSAEGLTGSSLPRRVDTVDALLYLVHSALTAAPVDVSGSDRYQVVVHVDADLLASGAEHDQADPVAADDAAGGRCALNGGPAVSVHTAWRMACDAQVRAMVHDTVTGRPVDVGRARRLATATQRRLLLERDGGCTFPGCSHTRFLHVHHVVHWLYGGPTDVRNLILLCTAHHRAVHEGGVTVTAYGSRFVFHGPDGREIRPVPPAVLKTIPIEALGGPLHLPPRVDRYSLGGRWQGDRLNVDDVVAGLRHRLKLIRTAA
ncbi:MAG: DUF222 domain-containing protein [Kribbellaceae bacterium]